MTLARAILVVCSLAILLTPRAAAGAPQREMLAASAPPIGARDQTPLPPAESHAWLIVPDARDGWMVLHVPPRWAAPDQSGKSRASPDGSVRAAGRLTARPTFVAAWDDRLYFLDDAPPGFAKRPPRRVSSLRAVKSPIVGAWTTADSGRPSSHRSLEGEGELLAFGATRVGPAALIDTGQHDPGRPGAPIAVHLLVDSQWRVLDAPRDLGSARRGRFVLQGGVRGLTLAHVGATVRVWSAEIDEPDRASASADPKPAERSIRLDWSGARDLGPTPGSDAGRLLIVGEQILWITSAPVALYAAHDAGWRELARPSGVDAVGAAAGLEGVGRVLLASQSDPWPASMRATSTGLALAELSATSGRAFYSGPARPILPISFTDLRVVAIVLALVMAFVLVFVLKGDDLAALATLPPGTLIADPARRLVASLIDLAIGLVLASKVLGVGVVESLSMAGVLGGSGLRVVALALAFAAVLGGLGEAVFGRSIGKAIVACEVIRVRRGDDAPESADQRPRPISAVTRNAIKWLVFPLGITLFLESSGRHAADRFCGTAVVVRTEDEPEEDEPR